MKEKKVGEGREEVSGGVGSKGGREREKERWVMGEMGTGVRWREWNRIEEVESDSRRGDKTNKRPSCVSSRGGREQWRGTRPNPGERRVPEGGWW